MALGNDAVDGGRSIPLEGGTGLALEQLVGERQQLTQEPTRCEKQKQRHVIDSVAESSQTVWWKSYNYNVTYCSWFQGVGHEVL